jgi:Outer membrane protein beta-barrel domain
MQNNEPYRMYENDIDRLFGSKLENDRITGADTDWEGLQKKLDAHDTRRKKPVFGKWMLGLLLLSGITAGIVYMSSAKKATNNNTAQQQSVTVKDNTQTVYSDNNIQQPPANTTTTGATGNNITVTETATTGNQVTTTAPVNTNPNISTVAMPATSATPTITLFRKNDEATGFPKKYIPNRKNKNIVRDESGYTATGHRNAAPVKKELPATVVKDEAISAETIESNVKEPVVPEVTPAADTEKANPDSPLTVPVVGEPSNKAPVLNASPEIPTAIVTAAKTKTKKEKKTRVRREAPDHDFSSGRGQWMVEAFSGYNNSIKDNKSFAAFLAPSGYVEKRLNQENALVSIQAGVNFKYRKNHFIFGTGLSYLELGDMVRYDAAFSGPVALDANGRAKLTYLEIPLSAGYDWASKRWGFSLQGGISAGMLIGAKGQYVSVNSFNTSLFDLNTNKSTFRKMQLNLLVTPSVNYYMNGNTNLFLSPLYRLNLQPVTIPGASINQKYYGMGIRIGIRTTLGKN